MPRALTVQQIANVNLTHTWPIVLVAWEHSGVEELLSASGSIFYDGQYFPPGTMVIDALPDGREAAITVPATHARVLETLNGGWRGGACKIYGIPAAPGSTPYFLAEDAVLLLDGIIASSTYSGDTVRVFAIHTTLDGNYSPRNIVDEVANYLPAAGSVLDWEGDNIVLESKR